MLFNKKFYTMCHFFCLSKGLLWGHSDEKHQDAHFHDELSIAMLAKFSENGKSQAVRDASHLFFY